MSWCPALLAELRHGGAQAGGQVGAQSAAIAVDLDKIKEVGCDAYLSKPINVENFMNTVKGYLG